VRYPCNPPLSLQTQMDSAMSFLFPSQQPSSSSQQPSLSERAKNIFSSSQKNLSSLLVPESLRSPSPSPVPERSGEERLGEEPPPSPPPTADGGAATAVFPVAEGEGEGGAHEGGAGAGGGGGAGRGRGPTPLYPCYAGRGHRGVGPAGRRGSCGTSFSSLLLSSLELSDTKVYEP